MQNLVSIVMPCFNSETYISESIVSVLIQTYINWELIVVDDCSTDSSFQILESFAKQDNRIKIFKLSENSGTGKARNFALSKCSGNFIAFLDADDLWTSNKLQAQLDFMQKNNLNFTFSFYHCIDDDGKSLQKMISAPTMLTYRKLFFCNFIGNLTAIYDADFFGKIPISSIRKRQDWMLWLTILKEIRTARPVQESLAYYRVRKNSISASKWRLLEYNFNVYRNYHGFNFIKSSLCMAGFLFTQFFVKRFFVKKI